MAQRQQGNEEKVNQQTANNQKGTRGVQTVAADENRDRNVKTEPDTERIRSEEQSVKDGERNRERNKGRR
jgi:hypothetical protein